MARYTNEPEQLDDCRHCTLLPTATGWVRAVQVGCPEHSEHPSARRVRTQAERDADGQAWRAVANSRPGYATWPQTAPGDPSWWRHGRGLSPVARVMAGLDGPPPVDGETCPKWCGFCHLNNEPAPSNAPITEDFGPVPPPPLPPISYADQLIARHGQPMVDALDRARARYEADKPAARLPRRRWWHRLTRRNP